MKRLTLTALIAAAVYGLFRLYKYIVEPDVKIEMTLPWKGKTK